MKNEALAVGHVASGGVSSPIDGVVTRWRVRVDNQLADQTAALRVIRGDVGSGRSGTEQIPIAAGTYAFSTMLPIKTGDALGLDASKDLRLQSSVTLPGDSYAIWRPPLAEGGAGTAPTSSSQTGFTNDFNADIEPDADNDRFGDETQDLCPIQADGQGGACDFAAPTSEIRNGPKKKTKSQNATFKFTSDDPNATFQCRLEKKPFAACTSPKKYKKLKVRKHRFRVQATDSKGNVGPIDSFRWRVVD